MKQIVLTLLCVFTLLSAGLTQAQVNYGNDDLLCDHCQQVALDKYHCNSLWLAPYKVAYWCSYSKECFFETDAVPENALVYNIEEIKNYRTNIYLPATYVVNMDSLNFFALSFYDMQQRPNHWNETIYYRTPNSAHAYLGVRGHYPTMQRINNGVLLQRYGSMEEEHYGETEK